MPVPHQNVRQLFAATVLATAAMAACGESADPPTAVVDSGTPPPMDAGLDAGIVRECSIYDEGTQRACSCGAATGKQACLGGKYTSCNCTVPDAGGGGGLCKAGFYSGEFTGKYKPGAFGLGLFPSFFEVDIAGAPTGNFPALSFTLQAKAAGAGEFATFSVENGCMVGSAAAVGTNSPFAARIVGSLDCRTGVFDGVITGKYSLVNSGLPFDFTGPLSAQFELPQARLKDGVWNVKEPPALTGEPQGGGGGTWSAVWDSDTAPASGEDPCAILDTLVTDGGVADAGNRDAAP